MTDAPFPDVVEDWLRHRTEAIDSARQMLRDRDPQTGRGPHPSFSLGLLRRYEQMYDLDCPRESAS